MTAYGKGQSFEENFLGNYGPVILAAAERENISLPDMEDGISFQLLVWLALPCNFFINIFRMPETHYTSSEVNSWIEED